MLIRDDEQETARMRVTFYTRWRVRIMHPVFEIDLSVTEGDVAYDVFYEYGHALMKRPSDVAKSRHAILCPEPRSGGFMRDS